MMTHDELNKRHPFLQLLKFILKLFYARHTVIGIDHVRPAVPAVFVCNHLETYAPIVLSIYFPYRFRPWVQSKVMFKETCRDYLEIDFTQKSLKLRPPFSKWLAGMIAPLCVSLMKSIEAIPVFRGQMRIRETLQLSVRSLQDGIDLVIFPENQTKKFSEFLNDFHTGFVHLARQYRRATGKSLCFYPVYVDSRKKSIIIGKGIEYTGETEFHVERAQIIAYLRDSIDEIARQD